jgi:competence protein ComEC
MRREIITGLLATLLTAPIIAWTFGRVSLIAPVSNILAGPVVTLLQPALFLALLWALSLPDAEASWLPDATQPLMALFDGVATLCSRVPGGVLPISLTLATAAGTGVAAALFVRATASRRYGPWLVASAAAAVTSLWLPLTQRGTGQLEVHVLDVGQGDAIAVRTPRGRWVLVDAGRRWQGGDAGRRTVVPYVRRRGGDVALFVLSHPHDDHAGGAASVVRALSPKLWWEPAFVSASSGYRDALQAVHERGATWERVRPGRRFTLDHVTFTVLAPDSAWTMAQHDANETSVVLRIEYGAHRVLLTGDAERSEEAWLVQRYTREDLAADVLKLGHHGSRTSTSSAFLDAVSPRVTIASAGAGNRYGHPAPETLANLLERQVPVLRTDLEGSVVVRSDGRVLTVEAGGDRWILPGVRRVE